jgi:predicted TIM-barrel fold metal-dependent hydrolase
MIVDDLRTSFRRTVQPLQRAALALLRPLPRLDRYAPVSMLRVGATEVRAPLVPVIDAHNHLGRWLSRDGGWMAPDVGALLAAMDGIGVTAIVNLDGRFGSELSENVARYDAAHPGRFATFCHLDWSLLEERDGPARLASQLRESAARGARGIKVWKDLGRSVRDGLGSLVLVDDPRLTEVWNLAGELGLPVLVHIGDPPAFFRPADRFNERLEELRRHPRASWHRAGLPTYDRLVDALQSAVASAPDTTWIGAHVASQVEDLDHVAQLLDEHPNLHIDLAARAADLGRQPRAARRFITTHRERVLFGTDVFPFRIDEIRIYLRLLQTEDEAFAYSTAAIPPAGRWTISGLDLDEDSLRAVYAGNARRLVPGL